MDIFIHDRNFGLFVVHGRFSKRTPVLLSHGPPSCGFVRFGDHEIGGRKSIEGLLAMTGFGRLLPFAVWILNQFERLLLVEAAVQDAPIRDFPTERPVSVRKQSSA